MRKGTMAKRIGLALILMGLLLSLFVMPSFADDTTGTSVIAETEENPAEKAIAEANAKAAEYLALAQRVQADFEFCILSYRENGRLGRV